MLPIMPLSKVSLAPDGVQCLVVNFAMLSRADALRLQGLLSASEQARYASIVFEGERLSQSRTRASLRLVLGRMLGISPDALAIAVGLHGKPYCSDAPDLRFSVSHSGSFGLLAFSTGAEVGCDIEIKRLVDDSEALGALVLHPAERQALTALPQPARHAAFLRCWVRKEAVLKATGLGFRTDPTRILVTQNQCTVAIAAPEGRSTTQVFLLHDSPLAIEYQAALASPHGSCHWARLQL